MMKPSVEICLVQAVSSIQFADDEAAQAGYDKIATALKEFSRFGNDKTTTVEVETIDGSATFRVESIQSILLNKAKSFESALYEKLMVEKRGRDMREELGLPALAR
jgi:hypothetical protein